jgi:hypothetical protein
MDKWLDFYQPYFANRNDLEQFVQACEDLELHDSRHRAKIMMHQGKRLISLADKMEIVEAGYQPLKLLFLLICAENISKLNMSTEDSGNSRDHVIRFFRLFCSLSDQQAILKKIDMRQNQSSLGDRIGILYKIRCDVVHEGHYWDFQFATDEHPSVFTGLKNKYYVFA